MFYTLPLLLAVSLAPTLADANTAYSAVAPVQVASCRLEPITGQTSAGEGSYVQTIAGTNLSIKYVNATTTPISSVRFDVTDGNRHYSVADFGTFSPGIAIAHSFASPFATLRNVSCKASSALFADGSNWTMPTIGDNASDK